MPTALLSEARNTFLAVQKARTRAEADRDRRVLLGFTTADAEMAAAVAAQVQIIREAKLKKRQDELKEAERKAGKDASADIQATDTPANATAEAEERDPSPGPLEQGAEKLTQRPKTKTGIMKPGCEKTPRKFIFSWYLAKSGSAVDEFDDTEVDDGRAGKWANLTDGEKGYKTKKTKKDQQADARLRARKGVADVDQGTWTEAVYEFAEVEYGHAGAGRSKVRAAQESLASQLTPLARELISFSMQLSELCQRPGLVERTCDQISSTALRGHVRRGRRPPRSLARLGDAADQRECVDDFGSHGALRQRLQG